MFVNKKPSQFQTGVAIDPVNDVIPRSGYVSPGVYVDAQTSVNQLRDEMIPLAAKGDILSFDTSTNPFSINGAPDNSLLQLDSASAFGFKWGNQINQDLLDTSDAVFKTLTLGTGTEDPALEVDATSAFKNAISISTPLPVDPENQSPQIFLTKETQLPGEFKAFAIGWKDTFEAAYMLCADFGGGALPSPLPIYINPLGGNVAVGALDTLAPEAEAQLHVFSDKRAGIIVSGEGASKINQLHLGYNVDTQNAQIQAFSDSVALDPAPILINSDGGFVSVGPQAIALAPLHVHGKTYIGSDSNTLKRIELTYDPATLKGVIQSNFDGTSLTELNLNAFGAKVSVNLDPTIGAQSPFHVEGDMFLRAVTTPSTPTVTGGKVYPKADGNLYFLNDAGLERALTGAGSDLVTSVFGRIGDVVATSGDYTASQVTNAADKASLSTQTFSAAVRGSATLTAYADDANVTTLICGADATNSQGYIQSQDTMGVKPIMIQPFGGKAGFGFALGTALQSMVDINGGVYLSNTATPSNPTAGGTLYSKLITSTSNLMYLDSDGVEHQITNGAGVGFWSRSGTQLSPTTAGDSIATDSYLKLNNSGPLVANKGISLFSVGDDYKFGFDDNGGSRGWIRTNVDAADAIHGFIWSAGPIASAFNSIMLLDGFGNLTLSAAADLATVQSRLTLYGDMFFGNIAFDPAAPTVGIKLYAKATSQLVALDAAGTKTNLTGLNRRTITASGANLAGDDIIMIDTTAGNVLLTVDVTKISRELTIIKAAGANVCEVQATGGQFISGISGPILLANIPSSITIKFGDGVNGYITGNFIA